MGINWIKSSLEQTDIPGPVRGFFFLGKKRWCFKQYNDAGHLNGMWELWEFDHPNASKCIQAQNTNDLIQSAKILSGKQQ